MGLEAVNLQEHGAPVPVVRYKRDRPQYYRKVAATPAGIVPEARYVGTVMLPTAGTYYRTAPQNNELSPKHKK